MMESLADYFQPLTLGTMTYGLYLLYIHQSIGSFVIRLAKLSDTNYRYSTWVIGMGIYSLVWFILHQFIPLTLLSIVIYNIAITIPLSVINLRNGFFRFPKIIYPTLLLILIIVWVLPLIWIKSSLPPYLTDEMAYHFMSPSQLRNPAKWEFSSGIYHVIPKNLETFWNTTFVVTKSYSLARLFHFLILLTTLLTGYEWLKERTSPLFALIFPFLYLYIPQDVLAQATSGYVDVASASFTFLAILASIDFIVKRDKNSLILSSLFWGLAVGTKYSVLSSLASMGSVVLAAVLISYRKYLHTIVPLKHTLATAIIGFFLVGGYWYLKNLYFTQNPTYPFIFKCRPADCVGTTSFFSGWTKPITFEYLPSIVNDIFAGNRNLIYLFAGSIAIFVIGYSTSNFIYGFLILSAVIMEFLLLKKTSGYLFRYFIHFQLLAILFITLETYTASKNRILKLVQTSFLIMTLLVASKLFIRSIKIFYSPQFTPPYEVAYASGKSDIYSWTDNHFPIMRDVIRWCDTPNSDGTDKTITTYDPDLIWFTYEGQMRVFVTHCKYGDFLGTGIPLDSVPTYLREQNHEFYIASSNPCTAQKNLKKYPYETEHQVYMRNLNNTIVCNSRKILPGLYYFE